MFTAFQIKLNDVNRRWKKTKLAKWFHRRPKKKIKIVSANIPVETVKKSRFYTLGIVLKILTALIFFLVIFSAINLLRHRQLCSYQQAVAGGSLSFVNEINLCPNIIDTASWGQIIANSFNFNILQNLKVNTEVISGGVNTTACTDELNPLCWLQGNKPNLKQTDGYTNVLLVGMDTRPGGRLKNTDSIMLASLENNSGNILLLSFPRDLHVYYKRPGRNGVVNGKINAIYANDDTEGLSYAVEQITGKPVHYHVYIYFDTFISIIDQLGGIDIVLEKPFKDVYPCADLPKGVTCQNKRFVGDGQYGLYEYPAGPNHFDSLQALIFSRSRKYSSDYERASRQQQVVKAVIKNALTKQMPLNERLTSYINMYNLLKTEVVTNVELKEIAGVLSIFDNITGDVARVVADPSLGGLGKIIYNEGKVPGLGYSDTFRDTTYKQFQKHISDIWEFLPYYNQTPKVTVLNQSGKDISATAAKDLVALANPFWQIQVINTPGTAVGIKLYDLSNNEKIGSLRDIQSRLPGALIYNSKIDQITKSAFGEDILIVVGKSEL